MSVLVFVLVFAIIVLACTTQAAIGFGGNLIAMPLVALIEPDLVPGSVLIAVTAQNALMLLREREAVHVRSVASALVGRALGTGVAVVGLRSVTGDGLQVLVAITVLALVAMMIADRAPRRTHATMLGAGTLSGLFATISGVGGPPVAMMFQRESGPSIRSSMGGFFVVGTTITLIGLAVAGRLGGDELRWGFSLAPAGFVGFLLSTPLLPFVDRGWMRPAILIVSSAAAVSILVKLFAG
jgi:uncharacterized membrane protein YfcA